MSHVRTAPLSASHLSSCDTCGATVWVYAMQSGTTVALDHLAGEFIIDRRGHAYRSTGMAGYRLHPCQPRHGDVLARSVRLDEFLWL